MQIRQFGAVSMEMNLYMHWLGEWESAEWVGGEGAMVETEGNMES